MPVLIGKLMKGWNFLKGLNDLAGPVAVSLRLVCLSHLDTLENHAHMKKKTCKNIYFLKEVL